ncbi:MAG: succinate dehydrogenase cytochrome b subunit [Acidimicrobiia bacterium]
MALSVRRRSWFLDFYRSDVGKKWVMAITGIVGLAYVLFHMIGNLKIFLGAAEINAYAEWLREFPEPLLPRGVFLWMVRAGLLVALLLHVHAATALTITNWRARPVSYESPRSYLVANYASRTMRWSGVIVLLFIAYHLAHVTFGIAHPDFVAGDVHHNMIRGFQSWPVAIAYIVAMIALGFHIFHGAWSMFQSLGINHPTFNPWRRWFAGLFALVIVVGNISMPILIVTGAVS